MTDFIFLFAFIIVIIILIKTKLRFILDYIKNFQNNIDKQEKLINNELKEQTLKLEVLKKRFYNIKQDMKEYKIKIQDDSNKLKKQIQFKSLFEKNKIIIDKKYEEKKMKIIINILRNIIFNNKR